MSDVVIASNISIKTQRVFYSSLSLPNGPNTIYTGNINAWVEIFYVNWATPTGGDKIKIIDDVSGLVLAEYIQSTNPAPFSFNKMTENLQNFTLTSGSGITNPKSFIIPNGCSLVADKQTGLSTFALHGIQHINSP